MGQIPIYYYRRIPNKDTQLKQDIKKLLSTKKPIEPTPPRMVVNTFKLRTKRMKWGLKESFITIICLLLFVFPGLIYLFGTIKNIEENNYWYDRQDLYHQEEQRINELNKNSQKEYEEQLLQYQNDLKEYDEKIEKILSMV